ncbi:hypothetical protein N9M66_00885 [Litoreibacter sp.]|nr:hypothetical protein [Litoreibacter sp.]
MRRIKPFLHQTLNRLRGAAPEAPLWDRLDACGVAFRTPMAQLIEQYGSSPSVWSGQLDICTLTNTTPFIAGLAHPPAFQFSPDTDLTAPPRDLFCAVQANPDHRINYAKAIAALVPLFGNGIVGTASNTASRDWRFGHATLSCTVWPPDAQSSGRNTRHEVFPETITEASIWIAPAYRPAMTAEQLDWCDTATHLPAPGKPPERYLKVGGLTFDWPQTLAPLDQGLYLCQDDAALLKQITPGLIDILPRAWMRGIALDRITSGRGGKEAILSIRYAPSGQTELPTKTMALCDLYGDPNALDGFAEEISQRLELPIDIYEGPMD